MQPLSLAAAATALAAALAPTPLRAQPVKVDPGYPGYRPVSGISGNLSSVGSDTLNNLMTFWTERFEKFYPNVRIQVEGKGSSTAPPALISGTAQLGPMSREMKGTEIDEFEKKFGYKPTRTRVAVDSLAVFVSKDNPVDCLTMAQIDAVFSKSRRKGHSQEIRTWGRLGAAGDWASRPLSLYGRNSASGTYGFFKEQVLGNGDYRDDVKEQPGSASVVQGVTVDRFGIGYSGIGYVTPGVKPLKVAKVEGAECVEPTAENAYAGKYPIARFLYVYSNKPAGKPHDPLTREFLRMVLSRDGQGEVVKDGYFPLPAKVAREELAKLD